MAFNCLRLTHSLESRSTRFELGSARLVACLPAEARRLVRMFPVAMCSMQDQYSLLAGKGHP